MRVALCLLLLARGLSAKAMEPVAPTTSPMTPSVSPTAPAKTGGCEDVVDGHVTIYGDVVASAFTGCATLKSVTIIDALRIGQSAFANCASLTTVNMGAVETVEQYAFYGCTALPTVDMPAVETIEQYAFYGCYSLETVVIESRTAFLIGQAAFANCRSLTTVNMSAVETIKPDAFVGCTALTTVDMPSVGAIGSFAFYGCTSLAVVDMPVVETIGLSAFNSCTSLKTVVIESSIETIADLAFSNCLQLSNVSISGGPDMGSNVFDNCPKLVSVRLGAANLTGSFGATGCPDDPFAANRTVVDCVVVPPTTTATTTTAPGPCQKVPDADGNVEMTGPITAGFRNCLALKSIHLTTAYDIPEAAFAGCTQLHTVFIDFEGDMHIKQRAFDGCTALATVTLVAKYRLDLHFGAFRHCKRLVALELAVGDLICWPGVFWGCTSLVSLALPDALFPVGPDTGFPVGPDKGAFYGCTSLETISIGGRRVIVQFGANPFPSCVGHGLETAGQHVGANPFGSYQVVGPVTCQPCNVPELKINGNVTVIHNDSFYGCTAVESIHIPHSVDQVHPTAFRGFPRLRSVIAHADTWESVEAAHGKVQNTPNSRPFPSCFGAGDLFGLETDDNRTDTVACLACWGLSELTIPADVAAIRGPAFDGCVNLSRVVIPGTVGSVVANAFAGAPNIRFARIGDVLLEDGAFNGTQCADAFAPNSTVCDCVAVDGAECYVMAAGDDPDDTNMIIGIAMIATVGVAGVAGAVYYRQHVVRGEAAETGKLLM